MVGGRNKEESKKRREREDVWKEKRGRQKKKEG